MPDTIATALPFVIDQRYSCERRIGGGALGDVYQARHVLTDAEFAIKVLKSSLDEKSAQRFRTEAMAPTAIGHPGIVVVTDAGFTDDGKAYLVMELLKGETLEACLGRPLAGEAKLRLIAKLLEPLAAAHLKGFVHRDLKPENVFVTKAADGQLQIKILDFGLAKQLETPGPTKTGDYLGTPHYMSPEQWGEAGSVDATADIWAVGVMMYEIVAGERPFESETILGLVAALNKGPKSLSQHPGVNGELAELVERCLARDRSKRPKDAAELQKQLAPLIPRALEGADGSKMTGGASVDESQRDRDAEVGEEARAWRARPWIALLIVGASALVAGLGIGAAIWLLVHRDDHRPSVLTDRGNGKPAGRDAGELATAEPRQCDGRPMDVRLSSRVAISGRVHLRCCDASNTRLSFDPGPWVSVVRMIGPCDCGVISFGATCVRVSGGFEVRPYATDAAAVSGGTALAESGSVENHHDAGLPLRASRADFLAALRGVKDAVRSCSRGVHGTIWVRGFVQGASGAVTDVTAGFADADVAACVVRVVRSARFPRFQRESEWFRFSFRI